MGKGDCCTLDTHTVPKTLLGAGVVMTQDTNVRKWQYFRVGFLGSPQPKLNPLVTSKLLVFSQHGCKAAGF